MAAYEGSSNLNEDSNSPFEELLEVMNEDISERNLHEMTSTRRVLMKTLINEVVNRDGKISNNSTYSYEQILMEGLQDLNAVERKAIFLRFWAPCSIEQIATELKVSWNTADQIINGSIGKLRNHFLKSNLSSPPFIR